jgi:hypothetical protein
MEVRGRAVTQLINALRTRRVACHVLARIGSAHLLLGVTERSVSEPSRTLVKMSEEGEEYEVGKNAFWMACVSVFIFSRVDPPCQARESEQEDDVGEYSYHDCVTQ